MDDTLAEIDLDEWTTALIGTMTQQLSGIWPLDCMVVLIDQINDCIPWKRVCYPYFKKYEFLVKLE